MKGVLDVMRNLAASGMTMMIVTHEMGFARGVADRVAFVDGGAIVEEGAPAAVLDAPAAVLDAPASERTRRFLGLVLAR